MRQLINKKYSNKVHKLVSNNRLSYEGDVNGFLVLGATVGEFIDARRDIDLSVVMQSAIAIQLVRIFSVSQQNWRTVYTWWSFFTLQNSVDAQRLFC